MKAAIASIPHPETGQPLVEHVFEREELYHGPHSYLAPDLTIVLTDWRYRTIGLHDFTTNRMIAPAFGPTGDHRLDGILIGAGPTFRAGAKPMKASLLDVAPTVLHLLGLGIPNDLDGRVLMEILDRETALATSPSVYASAFAGTSNSSELSIGVPYAAEDDATIKQRLADLGYL